MNNKTWRRIGYSAIGAGLALTIAFAIIFQDGVVRFFATPRAPFQTVPAPPAADFLDRSSWLSWPQAADIAKADVFYIHSNAYYKRKLWNAPIDDRDAGKVRKTIALPNEAGPFSAVGKIYAPLYREATLYSLFTHKYDGLEARKLAYRDVRRAFDIFLATRDPAAPIFLVGYGQGGLYVQGLLRDYFQGNISPLRRKLVAAYVIGTSAPAEFLNSLHPAMPVCDSPERVRCLISYVDFEPRFDEEMERVRSRSLLWSADGRIASIKSDNLICVNPLSWRTDGAYEPSEKNMGAASATGIGEGSPPPAMPKAVGARCDAGILVVDTPKRQFLRRGDWFGAKWKPQPFNLFYYDIAENAAVRLRALEEILKVEPEPLEPIGETIDVGDSPVNKVPD